MCQLLTLLFGLFLVVAHKLFGRGPLDERPVFIKRLNFRCFRARHLLALHKAPVVARPTTTLPTTMSREKPSLISKML